MDILQTLSALTWLDGLALALLVGGWWLIGRLTEHPPANRPSVSVLMQAYRRQWMHEFVKRQPRIFDATVLEGLRQGITFLASTCMIAIGGGVALIGNAERLRDIADDLSMVSGSVGV